MERDASSLKAKATEAKRNRAEAKRHSDASTEAAKARLRSLGAQMDAAIQRPLEAIQQPLTLPGRYPLESLALALALGLIVGRSPNLARNVVGAVTGRDGKNIRSLAHVLVDAFVKH